MTLAFSQQLNGKPTFFPQKIITGLYQKSIISIHVFCELFDKIESDYKIETDKIHTMREDNKNRWKAGKLIHFVINNRTTERYQFAPIAKCVSTQTIQIKWVGTYIDITIDGKHYLIFNTAASWSGNDYYKICELSINDGFDYLQDFLNYFSKNFTGKIIHWTDQKY